MITGKSSIIAYFDQAGKPYYAIFKKGAVEKGQPIFRNDKDENDYDFAAGKESFEKTLQLLGYGDYTLAIDNTKNVTSRGAFTCDFRIGLEDNQPAAAPQNNIASIGAVSMDQVEAKAQQIATKLFKELMDKKELDDAKLKIVELEKENKELQKSTSDPFNKFLHAAAPHADAIIAGLTGKPIQRPVVLSGTAPDAVGEADPDAQEKVQAFVYALAEAKPNEWQSILVKLTMLIKNEPAKFETALNFI